MAASYFILNDNLVLLLPLAPGGYYSEQKLRQLAQIAEENAGFVKICGDQRIGLFVPQENIEIVTQVLERNGFELGAYTKGRMNVVSCIGGLCSKSKQDALSDAVWISENLNQEKLEQSGVKIGLNGCSTACEPIHSEDIALIAEEDGYNVYCVDSDPEPNKTADLIVKQLPEPLLVVVIDTILAFYLKEKKNEETIYKTIKRVGVNRLQKIIESQISESLRDQDGHIAEMVMQHSGEAESIATADYQPPQDKIPTFKMPDKKQIASWKDNIIKSLQQTLQENEVRIVALENKLALNNQSENDEESASIIPPLPLFDPKQNHSLPAHKQVNLRKANPTPADKEPKKKDEPTVPLSKVDDLKKKTSSKINKLDQKVINRNYIIAQQDDSLNKNYQTIVKLNKKNKTLLHDNTIQQMVISNYEKTIEEQDSKINTLEVLLKAEKNERAKDKKSAAEYVEKLNKYVNQVEARLKAREAQIKDLENRIKTNAWTIEEQDKALNEHLQTIAQRDKTITQLENYAEELKAHNQKEHLQAIAEKDKTILQLENYAEELKTYHQEETKTILIQVKDQAKIIVEHEQAKKEIENLRKEEQQLRKEEQQLRKNEEKARREQEQLFKSKEEQFNQSETRIERLRAELQADYQKALEEKEKSIQQLGATISTLGQEKDNQILQKEQEKQELERLVKATRTESITRQSEINKLTDTINIQKRSYANLEKKVAQLTEKKDEIIKAQDDQLTEKARDIAIINREMKKVEEELSIFHRKVQANQKYLEAGQSKKSLKENEVHVRWQAIKKFSKDALVLTRNDQIVETSASFCKLLGHEERVLIGQKLSKLQVIPELTPEEAADNKSDQPIHLIHADNNAIMVSRHSYEVPLPGGLFVLTLFRDVGDQKKFFNQAKQHEKEKGLLIKEMKSGLLDHIELVAHLLKWQQSQVQDSLSMTLLRKSLEKLMNLSTSTSLMNLQPHKATVNLNTYINEIVNTFLQKQGHAIKGQIINHTPSDSHVFVSITTALTCGYIVNELLQNTLTHAYPYNASGKIRINSCYYPDNPRYRFELQFHDDGKGIAPMVDFTRSQSIGLQMIKYLVSASLKGKISFNPQKGLLIRLQFNDCGQFALPDATAPIDTKSNTEMPAAPKLPKSA